MKHKNIAKRVLACGLAVAMVVTSGNYSSVNVSAAKKTKKAAKKTKAKGWKKYAIIAGCTIGGAAIGALAGPRVAKVAKKPRD